MRLHGPMGCLPDYVFRDRSEFITRGVEFFEGGGGTKFQTENLGGGY